MNTYCSSLLRDVNDHKCSSKIKLRYRTDLISKRKHSKLSDRKKNRNIYREYFHLLIKLNETKCIFSVSMHKTRQIHPRFRYFSFSKRNENFQNCLRYDRTIRIETLQWKYFFNNKSETNEVFIYSRCKKREKNEMLTPAISQNRRIAHLVFQYTEG